MNCSNCGTKIDLDSKFCSKCGVAIQIDKPAVTQTEYLLSLKKLIKFPHVNMLAKIRKYFSFYNENKRLVVLFIFIGLIGLVLLISQILLISTEVCYENPDLKCVLSITENAATKLDKPDERIKAFVAIAEGKVANKDNKSAIKNKDLAKNLLLSSGANAFDKEFRFFRRLIDIADIEIKIDDKINAESTLKEALTFAENTSDLARVAERYIEIGNLKPIEEITKLSRKMDNNSDFFESRVAIALAKHGLFKDAILMASKINNHRKDVLFEVAEAQLKENNVNDLNDIINQITDILISSGKNASYHDFAQLAFIQYKYNGEQSARKLLENSYKIIVKNEIQNTSHLNIDINRYLTEYALASGKFQILKEDNIAAILILTLGQGFANKIKESGYHDLYLEFIAKRQIEVKDFSNALISANMITNQYDQAKAITLIAEGKIKAGLNKDALDILNKALEISNTLDIKDQLRMHYTISILLAKAGDYNQALETAVKVDVDYYTVDGNLRNIIFAQVEAGDNEMALENARKFNLVNSYYYDLCTIAGLQIKDKNFDAAQNNIKQVLKYTEVISDSDPETQVKLLICISDKLYGVDRFIWN